MHHKISRMCVRGGMGFFTLTLLAAVVLALGSGCGNEAEAPQDEEAAVLTEEQLSAAPDMDMESPMLHGPGEEEVITLPPPVDPEEFPDGPALEDEYPGLATAALSHARLVELPEGVLVESGELAITQEELDAEIAEAPEEIQEELDRNRFFLLEQIATQELLVQEAQRALGETAGEERAMLQSYFRGVIDTVAEVSDSEVQAFFDENQDLFGGAPFDQIRDQIHIHLMQEEQMKAMDDHVRTLGKTIPISVNTAWVAENAAIARDNTVDQARASGQPTLISFIADSCVHCREMEPTREAVREKYEGNVNVEDIDVSDEQILAMRYGVQGIPLLLFFDKEGNEFQRHAGAMTQEEIEAVFAHMGVEQ